MLEKKHHAVPPTNDHFLLNSPIVNIVHVDFEHLRQRIDDWTRSTDSVLEELFPDGD